MGQFFEDVLICTTYDVIRRAATMSLRLLLLMHFAVLLSSAVLSVNAAIKKRSDNGTDLTLVVGQEVLIPVEDESVEKNEKEANKKPTTDVIPGKDSKDKQEH